MEKILDITIELCEKKLEVIKITEEIKEIEKKLLKELEKMEKEIKNEKRRNDRKRKNDN